MPKSRALLTAAVALAMCPVGCGRLEPRKSQLDGVHLAAIKVQFCGSSVGSGFEHKIATRLLMDELAIAKGCGRVGHRRVALSHVSSAPSSNWTCGFPASSSPTIFIRRRAPQAGQMAHSAYHWVQPTPFIQELIVPALPGGPPDALVFASEP